MRYYSRITIFENKKRINKLIDFTNNVIGYFNNVRPEYLSRSFIENQEAKEFRQKINLSIKEVRQIILASGTGTIFRYTPPPIIGGYTCNIDIIESIFLIYQYELQPSQIVDIIERAMEFIKVILINQY